MSILNISSARITMGWHRLRSLSQSGVLLFMLVCASGFSATTPPPTAATQEAAEAKAPAENPAPAPPAGPKFYIREYRVRGTKVLPAVEVEKAVYPFLGPERTPEDIEGARAALEKAYHDQGFQTVFVQVPPQTGRRGVVFLDVTEAKVGRLRVKGAKYYLPSDILRRAPSMQEGKVPNFNEVTKDIVGLNQSADLRVTPSVQPGVQPGTVDIDLTVKDKFPLHGSIELNNRYSADTKPLRVNASLSYNNLWQLGHSVGASFQVAPERTTDAKVFSGYYTAKLPGLDDVSLTLQGTKQDSNVSTLGGAAVAGRGQILGARVNFGLPGSEGFYQSMSLGLDYKHFDEDIVVGTTTSSAPIDYYPFSFNYNASWMGKSGFTEFNSSINFHARGFGSEVDKFDNKRYLADGSYIYFRGDLSRTQDLPGGIQLFGKIQGQIADSPLINSEQYAGGGLNTVRGYLESAALGDSGVFGTVELRSPSLLGTWDATEKKWKHDRHEWRVYAFLEGGTLMLSDPLPEQTSHFDLGSYGVGSRMRLFNCINGSVDVAVPIVTQGQTLANDVFVTFRVWADF
jgi:hemolysin activation/secretion protein